MLRFLLAAALLLALTLQARSLPGHANAEDAATSLAVEQGGGQEVDKDGPIFPEKVDLPDPTVVCVTCDGQGAALLDCDHCGGDGKGPCLDCVPRRGLGWVERDLRVLRIVDPEKAKKVQAQLDDVQASLDKFNLDFGLGLGSISPGVKPCPASCIRGKSLINRGHECLYCNAKGKVDCSPCKGKGEVPCQVCQRKKRRKTTCVECIGSGRSFPHDLETRRPVDCPWCLGRSLRNCGQCAGLAELEDECQPCAGSGKAACTKCLGTQRMPCRPCSGTGDLSGFVGKSGRCLTCKHKGFTKCGECKRGVADCANCEGTGTKKGPCLHCKGRLYTLCGGCDDGSSRAWLDAADRFLTQGDAKAAVEHIEVAIQRTESRHELAYSGLVGTNEDRRKLKRTQASELKVLKKRLSKAAKKLKD